MEPFKKSDLFVLPVTEKHFTEMNLLGIKVTAAAVIYVTQLYIAATTIILLIYIYIYCVCSCKHFVPGISSRSRFLSLKLVRRNVNVQRR